MYIFEETDEIETSTEERLLLIDNQRRCTCCRHAYTKDYGYSNYTVEGTDVGCKLMHFKPINYESYESEDKLPFILAIECEDFKEGRMKHFDVEDRCPFSNG